MWALYVIWTSMATANISVGQSQAVYRRNTTASLAQMLDVSMLRSSGRSYETSGVCLAATARAACLQVHSYVAVPQGKTAYLSEVVSGASALIASHTGAIRTAVVGRAKVERRSLVCLSLEPSAESFEDPTSGHHTDLWQCSLGLTLPSLLFCVPLLLVLPVYLTCKGMFQSPSLLPASSAI